MLFTVHVCSLILIIFFEKGFSDSIRFLKIFFVALLLASALSPCGGGAGLGRDRLLADPMALWRACGRVARLGVMAAGGQWLGAVA